MKARIIFSEDKQTLIYKIKYFIKRLLNRSRYDYKLSTNLNLNLDKELTFITKIKSQAIAKKKIFISTSSGFYYLENNKLYNIFDKNAFFGIARHKNKFFVACLGMGHHLSEGAVVSFSYLLNKIKNPKIEYKLRPQSFHDLKIHKGNLYLVNSNWKFALDEILKFEIDNNFIKLKKKIRPEIKYPFVHLNTVFFKKKSILLCYHNYSKATKMLSQICEFDNNWKFLNLIKTENLSNAHDVCLIKNKLSILNSEHGEFRLGKDKFCFPGKFLRGFDYDKKNYFIGVNKKMNRSQRRTQSPQIAIINKKTKRSSSINLPNMGSITCIKII